MTIKSVVLAGCFAGLLTGCSKEPAPVVLKDPEVLAWGIVDLTNGVSVKRELGTGRICTITPTALSDGQILCSMVVEKDGKVISRPRVQTSSGVPVSISDGVVVVEFTPRVK